MTSSSLMMALRMRRVQIRVWLLLDHGQAPAAEGGPRRHQLLAETLGEVAVQVEVAVGGILLVIVDLWRNMTPCLMRMRVEGVPSSVTWLAVCPRAQ
jgi:hypothetical protein